MLLEYKLMAYGIVMLIIMCRRLTLSLHISGETYFILAFPHSEKTIHSLKQITLKSIQKPSSRATLQLAENQIVIKS